MTFFRSAGIKERRSKADFAPTWRRRRDLNPRAGFIQPTPLAGEPLRPLGYFCKSRYLIKEVAERVGFEPTDAFTSPVFKTGSLNRSDISPS